MISKQNSTLRWNDMIMFSFLGAVTGFFILLFYATANIYLIAYLMTPYSYFHHSIFEIIILRCMITIIAPIFFIPLFIPLFPYSKIDFSSKAIVNSILHATFFICTLPILFIFIYIEYFLINLDPVFKGNIMGVMLTVLLLLIPLLAWVYVSLHIKELIFGKNSSQTLWYFREFRVQKLLLVETKVNLFNEIKNKDKRTFTNRRIILLCGVLGFSIAGLLLNLLDFYSSSFLLFLFSDIFFILCSIPSYKHLFKSKNISFKKATSIYRNIFGKEDISDRSFSYGFFLLLVLWSITSFGGLYPYPEKIVFIFLYFISIIVFAITIWSNQFKRLIHKKKKAHHSSRRIHSHNFRV